MKVTLLNKDEVEKLYYWWGIASCVCYDTKTNAPEKIGKHCGKMGHYSGGRSQYILFKVEDCPRFVADQAVRHEVGVIKNVQSFRYVNKNSFAYEVPIEIADNQLLLDKYVKHMSNAINLYDEVQSYISTKTGSQERANEQARYILPMATHMSFVFGFTLEALIHYCQMRLCVRTEDKHRELAKLIKKAVLEVLPELKDQLVPMCQWNLYCKEGKKGCGAYPTREELKEIVKENKNE